MNSLNKKPNLIKNIAIIFLIPFLFSCQEDKSNYKINGIADGVSDGILVQLKMIDENGKERITGKAVVANEKFKIKGEIDEPTIHFLSMDKLPGELIFMLENNEIDININKSNLILSKVTGSESNEGYISFQQGMAKLREESRNAVNAYRAYGLSSNKKTKDSLFQILERLSINTQEYPLLHVKKNKDSYFSLNLIDLEASKPKFNAVDFLSAFENLNPKLKKSKKGIRVKQKLDSLIAIKK